MSMGPYLLMGAIGGAALTHFTRKWRSVRNRKVKVDPPLRIVIDKVLPRIDPELLDRLHMAGPDKIFNVIVTCHVKDLSRVKELIFGYGLVIHHVFTYDEFPMLNTSCNKNQLEKLLECPDVTRVQEVMSSNVDDC